MSPAHREQVSIEPNWNTWKENNDSPILTELDPKEYQDTLRLFLRSTQSPRVLFFLSIGPRDS